ncbi:MAG: two-component regulator propeller domain-containing protein, partial [Candidatus Marinimicrobia bacterium]|nr:two-component regulator propeller domain-containing protein [Candidatus Neomarinimicrobiota bacterium]
MIDSVKLLLLLVLASVAIGQDIPSYQFETIDINDGLSLNNVMTITQDKYGFMWFGTEDGLNRYDGVSFKVFRHDPLDSTSINSSSIFSTLVDSHGDLWVATYVFGLNKYDYETESFLHYPKESPAGLTIGDASIYSLLEDHNGYIWLGTSGSGLFRFDPVTGQLSTVQDLISNDIALTDSIVYSLFEDHNNQLWIPTLNGLNVLDLETFALRTYKYDPNDSTSLFDNSVNCIYESFDGGEYQIWIGTNWGGFEKYDQENDNFIHYGIHSTNNPDYPETSINYMIQENQDRIWLGTDSKGIMIVDTQGNLLETIARKIYDDTALNDDVIQHLYDDGDIIWVATSSGGVGKYVRNRKKIYTIGYDPLDPDGLHDNRVVKIEPDQKGNFWIATWTTGLSLYNPESQSFKVFQHDPDDPGSVSDNAIQDMLVDKNNNLWVISGSTTLDVLRNGESSFEHLEASQEPGGLPSQYLLTIFEDQAGFIWFGSWEEGLFKLDPATMQFQIHCEPAVNNITLGDISFYSMFEDSRGMLWIGAENEGLISYNQEKGSLKQFKSVPGDPYALPNNDVMCFHEDDAGFIWLGTYGGGLTKFDPLNNTFENFGIEQGLVNAAVYKIFEDIHGHLWLSTNYGLARFDKEQKLFKSFGVDDGVLSKEFNPGGCVDENGLMYFCGVQGVTYFDPTQITDNKHIPPIHFTDLSIMNYPIEINKLYHDRLVLERSLTENPTIQLFPEDLFFSVRFSALDYYYSENNQYTYFMEGFEDKWRNINNRRSVTFTNLAPGKYTLHVKGSNNDGVWNEVGTSLDIVILPEFYETWWFIAGIVLLSGLSILQISRMRTAFLVQRGEELKRHNIELNTQIESRRKAHRKARQRADYFRSVISLSPVPMAIHNVAGNITHLNQGWVDLWGAEKTDDIIRDYQVDQDSLAQQFELGKHFHEALGGEIIKLPEVTFTAPDGQNRVVHILLYPLKEIAGSINQVMISMEDVTEIVHHRELIEKSLVEKELLLKEVHHRVKNNLQIIASLLGLQKAGMKDGEIYQTIDDFRNRVNSMALVHDALYRSPEFNNIDIAVYIENLIKELQVAFKLDDSSIQLLTDIPGINLSVDLAIPCGLIINELITNSLKYAFPNPGGTNNQITIKFTRLENDYMRIEVHDNGVGVPEPVVWDSVQSLGLYLVKILSEQQLMGTVDLN